MVPWERRASCYVNLKALRQGTRKLLHKVLDVCWSFGRNTALCGFNEVLRTWVKIKAVFSWLMCFCLFFFVPERNHRKYRRQLSNSRTSSKARVKTRSNKLLPRRSVRRCRKYSVYRTQQITLAKQISHTHLSVRNLNDITGEKTATLYNRNSSWVKWYARAHVLRNTRGRYWNYHRHRLLTFSRALSSFKNDTLTCGLSMVCAKSESGCFWRSRSLRGCTFDPEKLSTREKRYSRAKTSDPGKNKDDFTLAWPAQTAVENTPNTWHQTAQRRRKVTVKSFPQQLTKRFVTRTLP